MVAGWKKYFGERTLYKYHYPRGKEQPGSANKFDVEKQALQTEEAKLLGEHFINRKLFLVPAEDSFANFTRSGSCGYSGCEIEYSTTGHYSFKQYNSITYRENNPGGAREIMSFANMVFPFLYIDRPVGEFIEAKKQYDKANRKRKN